MHVIIASTFPKNLESEFALVFIQLSTSNEPFGCGRKVTSRLLPDVLIIFLTSWEGIASVLLPYCCTHKTIWLRPDVFSIGSFIKHIYEKLTNRWSWKYRSWLSFVEYWPKDHFGLTLEHKHGQIVPEDWTVKYHF